MMYIFDCVPDKVPKLSYLGSMVSEPWVLSYWILTSKKKLTQRGVVFWKSKHQMQPSYKWPLCSVSRYHPTPPCDWIWKVDRASRLLKFRILRRKAKSGQKESRKLLALGLWFHHSSKKSGAQAKMRLSRTHTRLRPKKHGKHEKSCSRRAT